jgi:hypothetical protein
VAFGIVDVDAFGERGASSTSQTSLFRDDLLLRVTIVTSLLINSLPSSDSSFKSSNKPKR